MRWAAEMLGERIGMKPEFTGQEASTALLSNSSKAHQVFGYPRVSLWQMIEWVGDWVKAGGETWNKPTHFQEREGKY
jgi:hypothetical protein